MKRKDYYLIIDFLRDYRAKTKANGTYTIESFEFIVNLLIEHLKIADSEFREDKFTQYLNRVE